MNDKMVMSDKRIAKYWIMKWNEKIHFLQERKNLQQYLGGRSTPDTSGPVEEAQCGAPASERYLWVVWLLCCKEAYFQKAQPTFWVYICSTLVYVWRLAFLVKLRTFQCQLTFNLEKILFRCEIGVSQCRRFPRRPHRRQGFSVCWGDWTRQRRRGLCDRRRVCSHLVRNCCCGARKQVRGEEIKKQYVMG